MFWEALQRVKPSVSKEEIRMYEEFTKLYGVPEYNEQTINELFHELEESQNQPLSLSSVHSTTEMKEKNLNNKRLYHSDTIISNSNSNSTNSNINTNINTNTNSISNSNSNISTNDKTNSMTTSSESGSFITRFWNLITTPPTHYKYENKNTTASTKPKSSNSSSLEKGRVLQYS
jgi:hypothetical protein